MPVRRFHSAFLGLLTACWLFAGAATAAAKPVSVEAMLILASNEPAALDQRLEYVEYKLRRIFGFEYYRYYGEGSAILEPPASTVIDLGHGFRLDITTSDAGDDKIRASVRWLRGEEVVLNTTVGMKRNTPVILGGIQHEGGTLIVTLTAK